MRSARCGERAEGTRCESLLAGIFGPKRSLYKRVAEFSLYQVPEIYRLLARRPCSYLMACAETLAEQLSDCMGETSRARRDSDRRSPAAPRNRIRRRDLLIPRRTSTGRCTRFRRWSTLWPELSLTTTSNAFASSPIRGWPPQSPRRRRLQRAWRARSPKRRISSRLRRKRSTRRASARLFLAPRTHLV